MASTVCTACETDSVQCMTSESMRTCNQVLMQALQHAAMPQEQATPGGLCLKLTLSE